MPRHAQQYAAARAASTCVATARAVGYSSTSVGASATPLTSRSMQVELIRPPLSSHDSSAASSPRQAAFRTVWGRLPVSAISSAQVFLFLAVAASGPSPPRCSMSRVPPSAATQARAAHHESGGCRGTTRVASAGARRPPGGEELIPAARLPHALTCRAPNRRLARKNPFACELKTLNFSNSW